jgi:dipeptidyl-peptidase-4
MSRDGGEVKLLTSGAFDVASVAAVDGAGGWLYFVASPDNPAQRYLYRTRLDGSGQAERLTPEAQAGMHGYNIAPNARVALHTWSRFGVPPVTELVRLPEHQLVRSLVANSQLKARVETLRKGPAEFFQVDIGDGVNLNGWMMKPVDFTPNRRYPLFFTNYGGPGSQTVLDSWGGPTICGTCCSPRRAMWSRASTTGAPACAGGSGARSSTAASG